MHVKICRFAIRLNSLIFRVEKRKKKLHDLRVHKTLCASKILRASGNKCNYSCAHSTAFSLTLSLFIEWKKDRSRWWCDRRVACIGASLEHLDAFYLSATAATRSLRVCNDRNVFGGLFLDRSKTIFRSGLPTNSLTLTYVHVPTRTL